VFKLSEAPPSSEVRPVTDVIHGESITDPYRWLEEQESIPTRDWIERQTQYARRYLDNIEGRERIRARIREFLAVETYDSLRSAAGRYFFRKRLPEQEQPCIYMRDGSDGEDCLLVDPSRRQTGQYTAVKPLIASRDGRFLLYEVKQGGERTGTFEILNVETKKTLPDVLSRGYLRGFAFTPDGEGFCYVHEPSNERQPFHRAAYFHRFGSSFCEDQEMFCAGEHEKARLCLVSDRSRLGFLFYKFGERTRTSFYSQTFGSKERPQAVVEDVDYSFCPKFIQGKIFALTGCGAPNLRVIEVRPAGQGNAKWIDIVPEAEDRIGDWLVVGQRLFVSYTRRMIKRVLIFDLDGQKTGEMPLHPEETTRFLDSSCDSDELFFETQSFTEPIGIYSHSESSGTRKLWAKRAIPFNSADYSHEQVHYTSRDGTQIPMFLMGRRDVLAQGTHPTIMTSYGAHGVSMTPQFSVFVAFLVERGCLFALPNIRGGSEFGVEWHDAAKRLRRQTAYDDFLSAAGWLVASGRTHPAKLAIFGGSNAGLLVAAAMTQRPELFRAVLCMVPLLDMLRYHLFDTAHTWRDEFGTADDPDDYRALARYSPYHRVRDGVDYPATMIVSGDADGNCNPLHARKMTARLQAASRSNRPVLLDYSIHRGHSPVLPLSERINALTDRMAFLCDQLELPI
jgi:prolyl oligopeptidase